MCSVFIYTCIPTVRRQKPATPSVLYPNHGMLMFITFTSRHTWITKTQWMSQSALT